MKLHLHVKKQYFDEIKNRQKIYEFRLMNEYWEKRLVGRHYDGIVICCGYPKKDDTTKRLEFKWHGAFETTITHDHFGNKPVFVYAIRLVNSGLISYPDDPL